MHPQRNIRICFVIFNIYTFEALESYRKRNCIEAFFNKDKNMNDGNKPRVHTCDCLRGRMFVQFLSLCYYEFLYKKIRQMKITVDEVLNKQHLDAAAKETHQSLKRWLQNKSLHEILDWFDCIECISIVKPDSFPAKKN